MFKRLIYFALLCLCLPSLALRAQAPQTLDSALADLSQRLGHTVTVNDLENWTFAQSNYPDTSLGCPQTGAMYAQVITSGVQYTLTYGGNVYDYRVSADQKIVVLCSTNAAPTPNPSENCPPAGDAAYLPPRLTIGGTGSVVAGGLPNLMRSGPGQSGSVVGEIPPTGKFTILDGPRCSTLDKLIWWQVNYNGTQGWTAEGQAGTYWLQPEGVQTPTTAAPVAPAVIQRITADNALQLRRTADFGGQTGVAALSPDGKLAVIGLAEGGLILYNPQTNTQVATLENIHKDSVAGSGVTAIAFGTDGRLLATAGQNNQILTWDIGRNGTVGGGDRLTVTWGTGDPSAIGARVMYGTSSPANALAFSPDGLLLAGGTQDGKIYIWQHQTYSPPGYVIEPLMILSAHTTAVMHLSFSNDGTLLFSVGADGSSAVWGVSPTAG